MLATLVSGRGRRPMCVGAVAALVAVITLGLGACGDHDNTTGDARTTSLTSVRAPAPDRRLVMATRTWKRFVDSSATELLERTKAFTAAVRAGDVAGARDQFATTRRYYERIEPVADSIANLASAIDARVNDVAGAGNWTGFHRIERALFAGNTTRGVAKYADKLLADVAKLNDELPKLGYQGPQLVSSAVALLNEISTTKVNGEEDRYSHTDLSDLDANLTGARTAFEALEPVLADRGQQALVTTIAGRFAAVEKTLRSYRRRDRPSGWSSYLALTDADRRTLTQAVDALADPVSTVALHVSS